MQSTQDIRVELRNDTKDQLVEVAEHWGMTQCATLSVLIEWYMAQDEALQFDIVSGIATTTRAQQAKQIFKKMAGRQR